MASLENYRNQKFVDFCVGELAEYTQHYRGINAALIATPDGFEIASYSHEGDYSNANKLAAVGSSLFALGGSLSNEFHLTDCKSIILDSEKGKVYISAIQNKEHSVILMVQTSNQAILGNIIHGARKLNEAIATELATID